MRLNLPITMLSLLGTVVSCTGAFGESFDGTEPVSLSPGGKAGSVVSRIDPSSKLDVESACELRSTSPAPLRHLSRVEVAASCRQIFGVAEDKIIEALPGLLDSSASTVRSLDVTLVGQLWDAASIVADEAVLKAGTANKLTGCNATEPDCITTFLNSKGTEIYRRPLHDEEKAELLALHKAAMAEDWGAEAALKILLRVMIQSSEFFYRPELTDKPEPFAELDAYAKATRLSFLLWGTTPDSELLNAAADGELDVDNGYDTQVDRLLADPRSAKSLQRVVADWMELDIIKREQRDPELLPEFNEALKQDLHDEILHFVEYLLLEGNGTYKDLVSANFTFTSPIVAKYYGVPHNSTGWEKTDMDATQRRGIFGSGAFLASYHGPIHRGNFIYSRAFCGAMASPPDNIPILGEVPPGATTREILAIHRADPACAGCHNLIDPGGLAFEFFDGDGKYRSEENGKAINA